jgi:hypothetical protein
VPERVTAWARVKTVLGDEHSPAVHALIHVALAALTAGDVIATVGVGALLA